MSVRLMAHIWAKFPAGGTDLLAMLALADWSNDNGECYPSIAAIASKVRLSRSQAQRVVHRLIEQEFVSVIGNETGGPPGATRRYKINFEALTGSTDATGTGRMDATPTGRMDATGSVGATGRMDAADGSHGCAETGRMDATQTVSEPSTTVSRPVSDETGSDQPHADHVTPCPHQEIIKLYAKHLPELPQPRVWDGNRAANLKARWKWVLTAKKRDGQRYAEDKDGALDFFDRLFGYVAQCDFLSGRDGRWGGCDLSWLVKAENFAKVIEGKYQNRAERAA